MPTGIDQSFGFVDPATARAAGVEVVMMYLSHTPAKNATPAKVLAYHRVGIAVFLGWEATADRALLGYAAGLEDGREAARQYLELIAGVGYAPKNHPFIAPAYDFDTNPGQYPVLDQYARGFAAGLAGHFGEGAYGEADLLDHFHSIGLLKGGGFGTYAWSRGRISGWDDFHQYDNGQRLGGAEVDFDQVRHPIRLGAWWPPGHKYDVPEGDWFDMATDAELRAIVREEIDRGFQGPGGNYNPWWFGFAWPWFLRKWAQQRNAGKAATVRPKPHA